MNSLEERSRGSGPPPDGPGSILVTGISRTAVFFVFWLALTGADSTDLAAGSVAAVAATWTSLRLMPAAQWKLHPIKLAGFVLHFLRQSISAGADVALRALDPRLPLQPGFVTYRTNLPPGTSRNAFCAIMSLLPGTLPCGPENGNWLAVHCLDLTQPVAEQLAAEEALFVQANGALQLDG